MRDLPELWGCCQTESTGDKMRDGSTGDPKHHQLLQVFLQMRAVLGDFSGQGAEFGRQGTRRQFIPGTCNEKEG